MSKIKVLVLTPSEKNPQVVLGKFTYMEPDREKIYAAIGGTSHYRERLNTSFGNFLVMYNVDLTVIAPRYTCAFVNQWLEWTCIDGTVVIARYTEKDGDYQLHSLGQGDGAKLREYLRDQYSQFTGGKH